MTRTAKSKNSVMKSVGLAAFFTAVVLILFFLVRSTPLIENAGRWKRMIFSLVTALFFSGMFTVTLKAFLEHWQDKERPRWFYPILAGALTFCGLMIAYLLLGIWPIGSKTTLVVDMFHQYAPLLSKFREMLLGGNSFLYSFELGLGTGVLPALAYYAASPFNLLLLVFPQTYLAEGIFLITILKNVLTAVACAACLQYVYRRRSVFVVVASVMYSMMMYVLAYSWCIMWLDVVLALPLTVMALEYLMRTGKYWPYVLTLAYALLANYYLAFMLCVFLVLYFFGFLWRQKRDPEQNRQALWRFTVGSLIGGGISMILVLPTFMALGQTSASGAGLPTLATNFDMFELFSQHFCALSPTIRSGNLPNIYCGVAVLLLVPLFACNKGIPLRRRVTFGALLAVMMLSMNINQLDLIWHGLHAPNDLPYRFSFVYCFLVVLIAFETLQHAEHIKPGHIVTSLVGVTAYIILFEKFSDDTHDFYPIYGTLILLAAYAAVLYLLANKKICRCAVSILLLVLTMTELTLNACSGIIMLDKHEYFAYHKSYTDNIDARGREDAVTAMRDLVAESGDTFARMEFLPRHTCTDTALYNYPGLTIFASSNSYRTTRLMGSLGYAVNGVNSYMYHSFVPMTDSLLGLRYVALKDEAGDNPFLTPVREAVRTEGDSSVTYHIYENEKALPLAYRVNPEIKEWKWKYYNPPVSIVTLYSAMTGDSTPIIADMKIDTADESVQIKSETEFYCSGENNDVQVFATTYRDGRYYAYMDCRAAKDVSVSCNGDSWSVTAHEPYFIDLGWLDADTEVTATFDTTDDCSGNFFLICVDETVYEQAMDKLAADGLQVTKMTDTYVAGTVNASADGVMMVTIPYDKGWTVKVDGKTVDTFCIGPTGKSDGVAKDSGALLAFDVPAGEHTVTMSFAPAGFVAGIAVSVVCVVLLILLSVVTSKKHAEAVNRSRWALLFGTEDVDTPRPDEATVKEQMDVPDWVNQPAPPVPEEPAEEEAALQPNDAESEETDG